MPVERRAGERLQRDGFLLLRGIFERERVLAAGGGIADKASEDKRLSA